MLKPRLWLEALRQGIVRAPQVIWLSDGGRGLWRLFEERFAGHARGILDFYHAAQQLWKGAAAWLDGRTTRSRRWFVWARHRLRHGMPDGALADLTDALDVEGLPGDGTGHLAYGACLFGTASRAHRLCHVQGVGAAAGQWYGRKRVQMAHPAALQRSRDAVE